MKHLNTLISNKANMSPCYFYIPKFNVKKFCEINELDYSPVSSYFIGSKGSDIKGLHEHISQVTRFHSDTVVIHIDYREGMNDYHLIDLLSDREIHKNFVIILTNNKNHKGLTPDVTDLAINYRAKDTGFFLGNVSQKIRTILQS